MWCTVEIHNVAGIFVTFTPDDYNSIIVSSVSGKKVGKNSNEISEVNILTAEKRIQIAGEMHTHTAYFSKMLIIFIDDILGSEKQKTISKKSGGIFGITKVFIGGIEHKLEVLYTFIL